MCACTIWQHVQYVKPRRPYNAYTAASGNAHVIPTGRAIERLLPLNLSVLKLIFHNVSQDLAGFWNTLKNWESFSFASNGCLAEKSYGSALGNLANA